MFSAVEEQDGRPKRQPNQDALLGALGAGSNIAQMGPNAGKVDSLAPDAASAAAWRNDPSNPLKGMVSGLQPEAAPMAAPGEPKPFANDARGFLTNSLQGFAPTVRGITGQGDDARKKAVEDHIRSLLPELEARGMKIDDVRGEKILRGGRWTDLMRDVANGQGGGDAEVQWLEEDPTAQAAGPAPMGVGGGLDPSLAGDPLAAIQAEIEKHAKGKHPNQDALLAQLGA